MNFGQEFKLAFGDKYQKLHLKNVIFSRANNCATVTFLYPSTEQELSAEQKREITDFLKQKLALESVALKVKFMRVFVEEKLIIKCALAFLEEKFKLVSTYVSAENFSIQITPIDVLVKIDLSSRMTAYFAEHKVSSELAKHLKNNFLMEFVVEAVENQQITDDVDIQKVEMHALYTVTPRYRVEIVKEGVGKNFQLSPQFCNSIKSPKKNVSVAGFIKKIERVDYVRKTGARAGEQAVRFAFTIEDSKGKLDAIYFASKTGVKVFDALEEGMFVLVGGEVKLNQMGKLNLVVDKLALATIVEDERFFGTDEQGDAASQGHVVQIEKLTSLQQDDMFGQDNHYNSKIMDNTIVVFDIETTGLDFAASEIIELGAVKIDHGQILEKFSTFVKPKEAIPPEITALTGITDEMVRDAPKIDGVIRDFYEFTRGCVLCGHNAIGFDIKFIRRDGKAAGLDFDNEVIDTINEARAAKLKITRYNLASVLKVLGLTNEGAHRAWNDAFATAQVLLKLNSD